MFEELVPAYGRDYKSAKAAAADWKGGKDFRLALQGCYTSIKDWKPTDKLVLRYGNLMKAMVVTGA